MQINDFYTAIVIGVFFSLMVFEISGVDPGGLITPGYLALVCGTPLIPLITLLTGLLAFGVSKYILLRFVVLNGRRRFAAHIILAALFGLALSFVFPAVSSAGVEYRGFGIIAAASLASGYYKQGVKLTLAAVILSTLMTFGTVCLVNSYI